MTAVHLHADAVDALLASVTPSGGVSWYLTDNQGSVRAVLNAAGSVVDRITYDAFGGVAAETNPAAGGRFKYTAREWDGEIGLQYNRARYYDPSAGRWISQDPIGFAGGDANLYRYVGNSPTNATDPSGLKYQATGADGQVSPGSQIQASPSGSSGSSGVQDSGTPDYQSFLGFDPSALEPRSDTSPRRRKLAWDPFPSSAERLRIQTDQLQFGVGFVSSIVGSAAEMAGGAAVAYASGGLGSALGIGLVADGFDNLQATLFQRKTAKYQAVHSLTGSESLATLTEIGVPIALGFATSIPGVRSVGRGGGGSRSSHRSASVPGIAVAEADGFVGPTIGRSGYRTMAEFDAAVGAQYQLLVDQGYARTMRRVAQGVVRNDSIVIGSEVDLFARQGLRRWLQNVEGIQEGPGQIIQVNRRLYDPASSGSYRIPDVYIPGARSIFDATIAEKTNLLPQTIDFRAFSGGGNVTIVRPSTLVTPGAQGSYGLQFH